MPTAVTTARQCLTEEAASALDDAVSVAKRRNHAQTTSLHAVSALLSPSFSLLRDSLTRCRSSAYSPRLQFRALELCVGVSLDRLPSSKNTPHGDHQNDDFAPPISNSLMAAIKRSQANQRRQPEMYHFSHLHVSSSSINNNNPSISVNINNNNISNSNSSSSSVVNNNNNGNISISSIKVELKHFVLSILDDPIVSRVFGEAGFRSSEIKMAILHPPRWGPSPNSRCPPLFLCNLMDFPGYFGDTTNNHNISSNNNGSDDSCKRISEVMVKKKERNPLLVGVCAKDALSRFKDCILKQNFDGFNPKLHGVKLVCVESEVKEFVALGKCEDQSQGLDLKVKEVGSMVEDSSPGVVVNLGDLKVFVDDENDQEMVNKVVLEFSNLVGVFGSNIWLIGFAVNYETYSNFVGKFSSLEKDWDLHPLPITSIKSSFDGFSSKSSLMGSFVPFGGFFPTPSDYSPPITAVQQPFSRCNACNEKYKHEVGAILGEGSSVSFADQHSAILPSWLQRSASDSSKGGDVAAQAEDVKTASNDKIKHLQKKWDDHCRVVHQSSMLVAPGVSLARLQVPQPMGFPFMPDTIQGGSCSSGDSSLNDRACSNSSSGMQIVAQKVSPRPQLANCEFPKPALVEVSQCQSMEKDRMTSQTCPIDKLTLPLNRTTVATITTDLGLGTIYAPTGDLKKPFFQNSFPTNQVILNKKAAVQTAQSSFKGLEHGESGDYKSLFRKLSDAVAWQGEAVTRITEIVSCCRSGNGRPPAANVRGNIWLSFLGPDKIGKRRIAEALADALFGSRDRLISVDLSLQDSTSKVDSLFICQGLVASDSNMSRITVVDRIAQELCKKPHSIVFLENTDEADLLVRDTLSRAIQTGKFQDSRGREIGINNFAFVTTSTVTKDDRSLSPRKEFIKFQEEKILEAKNWQMQLVVRSVLADASRSKETTVSLLPRKCASNQDSSNKRKISDIIGVELANHANKIPKNSLDLNLPLEDEEEVFDMDSDGRAWLEDFFGSVDGNVEFKPFDFDALADKLLRKMRSKFEETYKGEKISFEIDHEVMVQILAAAWSSDKDAVDNWLEHVLYSSFAEAREKCCFTTESVVRLSPREGVPVKEWASGISLPKQIILGI